MLILSNALGALSRLGQLSLILFILSDCYAQVMADGHPIIAQGNIIGPHRPLVVIVCFQHDGHIQDSGYAFPERWQC